MRAMLISVAAVAFPSALPAQPAAQADARPKVADLVAQAQKATAEPEVVVEGCMTPADSEGYATRADRPLANREFDAPSRPGKRTAESPGTRAFVLRNIADFRQGTADFDHMSEAIARISRERLADEKHWIVCRGAFKDIRFLHVSHDDYDDFMVSFSRGVIEWEVKPLDPAGRTSHWAARFYYPEPETRQLEEFLRSVEAGRPEYDRLSPGFAPAFRAQWPKLQQAARTWRAPHSTVFLRREDDGAYTYRVAHGNDVVLWTVALDAAGKITRLSYDDGSG